MFIAGMIVADEAVPPRVFYTEVAGFRRAHRAQYSDLHGSRAAPQQAYDA